MDGKVVSRAFLSQRPLRLAMRDVGVAVKASLCKESPVPNHRIALEDLIGSTGLFLTVSHLPNNFLRHYT